MVLHRLCQKQAELGALIVGDSPLWSDWWLPLQGIPEAYRHHIPSFLANSFVQGPDMEAVTNLQEALVSLTVQDHVEASLLPAVLDMERRGEQLEDFWELWRTTTWLATGEPSKQLRNLTRRDAQC